MIIKQTKTIFTIALMALGCLTIMAQPKTKTRKVRTAAVNRQLPISSQVMKQIYEEVKTPYKYGMVVAPKDNYHKIDCPMVYREGGKWYMTYVVYNGKDGTDGRGYETWLATSDDLLHWNTLGRLLSYADQGWDMNQRAGYPALIDWTWNGSYEMASYKNRHWMSYFGGVGTGYEAVKAPLNMGMASTKQSITKATEWETSPKPVLSIEDKDAQWWEKLTHYKSTVYWDKQKTLGKPFVMFYNAGGINPANNLKAERIGIALSSNMTSWKRLPLRTAKRPVGNPVFYHEAPGIITGDAQIVKFPHYYVMFYFSAYNPTRKYNAYNTFAVSRDLVNWQDWEGSDLIYPSKPYDDMFAHKSYVLKHNGVVYHFYCAVNTAGQRGIAVATNVPMGRSEVSFPVPEKKGKRNVLSLDKSWQVTFGKTTEDSITKKMGTFQVDVPNNLDDYYGYRQLKHGNLHGTATYQKSFSAHKQQGKRYFLQLEGVGTFATVKVNNKTYPKELVGRTCFTLDITEALRDGDNKMTVKVEHPAMQTNNPWPCGGCSSEWGFSEGSQPFGIYRPVSLIETDEVRVEPFGVHVWNNEKCDSVFVETEVKNYGKQAQEIELTSKFALSSGKTAFRKTEKVQLKAGETKVIRQSAAIADVHLWSLEDPYLYTLSTLIKRGGKTIDDVATPYGIRTISWPVLRNKMAAENGKQNDGYDAKDGRFYLNGKPVFINGTCDYEHLFGQSHAFSHEQIASRVKLMRQAGFNAFREAHQPHNLYYQQLLDEQGMLFWSQFSAHVWYDTSSFRNNFKRLLRRWIKERRNSPSVILWGIQNESVLPKDFTEECSEIIREMDPTARTMRAITTCNGGEGSDWNVIQNWSGTYGGTADHYDQELKQPNQLLNGEYGAWRTLGFSQKDAAQLHSDSISLAKAYTEDAFTALLGKKAMLAESAKDSVCGHFQWIFVSHENPGRVQPDEAYRRIDKVGPFNYKGLLSPWEQPTSAFYWYRDHYAKGTFASATDMNAQTVAKDTKTPTAADRNKDILKPADGYTYLYRVNCGGDALVDSYGSEWEQDDSIYSHSWAERFGMNPFTASQGHILSNIHGLEKAGSKTSASTKSQSSEDAKLFQYFRWGRHALNYQFAVPDGEYRVELYFAEPWLGDRYGAAIDCEGERIFDVAINDSVVVNDLDLWAEAGFAGACKKVAYVKVKGGLMTISFPEVKVGEAIISAIAIAAKGEVDAPRGDYKGFAAKPKSQMSKTYWADLDKDVVEKYPKELLPQDNDVFPAIRYKSKTAEWTITPGVAREYMMRFRYKNTTGQPQVGRLKIVDSKGIVLVDRDMTFPETPNKFKTIGTTTDSQINAGTYRVTVSGVKEVLFEYLEIQ